MLDYIFINSKLNIIFPQNYEDRDTLASVFKYAVTRFDAILIFNPSLVTRFLSLCQSFSLWPPLSLEVFRILLLW